MATLLSAVEKKMPIFTAATPGAFRIFVIIFSSLFVASGDTAIFSTEYTLVAFFVMISGIGFSTILVKSMAINSNINAFFCYSLSSAVIGGGVIFLISFLAAYLVPLPDFYSVLLLVIATSLYQVFRSYLIFNKKFWLLLLNDVLVGFFYVCLLVSYFLLFDELKVHQVFVFLSISYFLSLLVVLLLEVRESRAEASFFKNIRLVSSGNTISSLVVGVSNAASGGVSFLLPSFFIALGGEEIAIVASLAVLVFSSIAAIPRGIINNGSASLSRMVLNVKFDDVLVSGLKNKIKRVIALLFPLLSFFILVYFYFFTSVNNFSSVFIFVMAIGFYVATAQLGVVESVLINLCGYESMALIFNTAMFLMVLIIFMLASFTPYLVGGELAVYLVPFILGLSNIFRLYWYRRLVKQFFAKTYSSN
ncbi:hypothetical protein [Halomonas sp. SpR8]|uniref:hypothetical protein n=1 Tax=Halomonas sp. SpR8 TaxID=3050463 RepID=UPI0027E41753|nr:hypothetical protein [Halomonas sp. SpR8]MDQ7727302.1 hypothetical protein [Halomonas sp. SpR8]